MKGSPVAEADGAITALAHLFADGDRDVELPAVWRGSLSGPVYDLPEWRQLCTGHRRDESDLLRIPFVRAIVVLVVPVITVGISRLARPGVVDFAEPHPV